LVVVEVVAEVEEVVAQVEVEEVAQVEMAVVEADQLAR
jgi:hypothetical protein